MSPEQIPFVAAFIGLCTGFFIAWLILSQQARTQAAIHAERLASEQQRSAQYTQELASLNAQHNSLRNTESSLREKQAELQVRLLQEKKAATEKQALLEKAETRLTDTFKALSAETLKSTQEQFLSLAQNSLKAQQQEANSELEKRKVAVEQFVKPIAQTLEKVQFQISQTEKHRSSENAALKQQIIGITEAHHGLQRETHKLVKALRQPTGRGQWGEMQLRRVVEMAGMQEHCDFETQATTTNDDGQKLRPDLIVKLPAGQRIVVDSKTPMDAYLDSLETDDESSKASAMARHAAQVRTHIQQLGSKKYQDQFEFTPEFVVLFLPSESFFSAALHQDSGLIEKGVDQNVILATPTTLIALLRAVAFGWRQEALAENAREISSVGKELYTRLGVFSGYVEKLGRSLKSAVGDYNKTVGSLESRVLVSARRFDELGAAPETAHINELSGIETHTREFSAETVSVLPSDQHSDNHDFINPSGVEPDPKSAADDLRAAFD